MYQDIPEELNVTLYEGDRNTNEERGVLGSKATGEPATHMGISVAFAIRNAIDSIRKEIDPENLAWYPLGMIYDVLQDRYIIFLDYKQGFTWVDLKCSF